MTQDAERPESEVFAELGALCKEPGYIHAIAHFCFRDTLISFKKTVGPKAMLRMFREDRLIRTEISTLLGLMVQGPCDYGYPHPDELERQVLRTEALLGEIHDCLAAPMRRTAQSSAFRSGQQAGPSAELLREPIFYGGESAYPFQYRDLAPARYGKDEAWLRHNRGFSVREAADIAAAVGALLNDRANATLRSLNEKDPDEWTMLPSFVFSEAELVRASGLNSAIVRCFLESFTHSGSNDAFGSVSDYNSTNAAPILRLDSERYALLQYYSLVEAIYESPSFWMGGDLAYSKAAAANRGAFTESFAESRLSAVFGSRSVRANVTLEGHKGRRLGEIDVLVEFGGRLIIVQAKAKRLTIAARKGNDGQLQSDFKKAVQEAYDQAFSCAQHLLGGACTVVDDCGHPVLLQHPPREVFLVCLVADHYPALQFQAREFLKFEETSKVRAPFVMDIFFLDALTEMLSTPMHLLHFVKRRTDFNLRLGLSHELTALSLHLKENLALNDDFDLLMLGDDIAIDLDIAMAARRQGMPGKKTPDGILTKLKGTSFERLVQDLDAAATPSAVDAGMLLLEMSGETARNVSGGINSLARATRADGTLHDFSMFSDEIGRGLTIHCSPGAAVGAVRALEEHCMARKYRAKASAWVGISIGQNGRLLGTFSDHQPWQKDDRLEAAASRLKGDDARVPIPDSFLTRATVKVGRNDPCSCGSGKKYKKCCLSK